MTEPSLARRPRASYDPYGTAIRLSYDPGERNVVDNPVVAHEVAHYGQNLTTGVGIERIFWGNELFDATAELLADWKGPLELPLAKRSHRSGAPEVEARARLALRFEEELVGPSDSSSHADWAEALTKGGIGSSVYGVGTPSRFYVDSLPFVPDICVHLDEGRALRLPITGRFVEELHALSVQFLYRWRHEQLTIDDAVQYFLGEMQRPPEFVPTLIASRVISERFGEGVFNVQDAVAICHMCAQVALCGTGLVGEGGSASIDEPPYRYAYRHPGRLFATLFEAALGKLQAEGAVDRYFNLMGATLTQLGMPPFERIVGKIVTDTLEPLRKASHAIGSTQQAQKLDNASVAFDALLAAARERDVGRFLTLPLELVGESVIVGPLLVGPRKLALIHAPGAPPEWQSPSREQINSYIQATVTHKLWNERRLSCEEPAGSPFGGPIIGNCDEPACGGRSNGLLGTCHGRWWRDALAAYPGLAQHLPLEVDDDRSR